MNTKKPTLQDVATLAGVSTATVSRCLNNAEKVRPDVCQRIQTAISELGYVPHGAARALASRRTRTIGAVVPTIDNSIFSEAIQHLQRGLGEQGYTLLLANSAYSPAVEIREVYSFLSRGIDGLVLVGEEHPAEVYEAIANYRIPHVNLWVYREDSMHSCIGLDNYNAGRKLARHLYELNHRHIGIISAFSAHNDRVQLRVNGVRRYLQEQGQELADDHIVECRYSGEQGRMAAHELLDRHPQLTAIICGNDILALGALAAARERGLSVPKELSVTGFDNLEILSVISPALTTIHVPSREMGQSAANYLLREINAEQRSIERIRLKTELLIRETTALARESSCCADKD